MRRHMQCYIPGAHYDSRVSYNSSQSHFSLSLPIPWHPQHHSPSKCQRRLHRHSIHGPSLPSHNPLLKLLPTPPPSSRPVLDLMGVHFAHRLPTMSANVLVPTNTYGHAMPGSWTIGLASPTLNK